jgi:hypothetical protein
VALGVAVYLRAAAGPFIWDDFFLLDQLKHYSTGSLWDVFTSGFLERPTGEGADFYRPMVTLSFLLDQWLWGNRPAGYHATNLLLHAISVLMVALFIRQTIGKRNAAVAGSLLFAVHPAHAESVCWISGRTDLMCSAFLLGGLNLYLSWRDTGGRAVLYASYFLVALALLSKELALTAPALAALAAWGQGERDWRRIVRQAIPFAALAAASFGVSQAVLYGSPPIGEPRSLLHQTSTFAYSLFTHFQILLLPHTAHLSYEVVTQEIANASTIALLLGLAILGWSLWSWRSASRVPLVGFMWFLFTILPVSLLAGLRVGTIVSQRFLYLPSAGLALVFGRGHGAAARTPMAREVSGSGTLRSSNRSPIRTEHQAVGALGERGGLLGAVRARYTDDRLVPLPSGACVSAGGALGQGRSRPPGCCQSDAGPAGAGVRAGRGLPGLRGPQARCSALREGP